MITTEQISDIEGYVDVNDLPNGTYLIKWLNSSNILVETDKIIIAK